MQLERKLDRTKFNSSEGVTGIRYVNKEGKRVMKGGPGLKATHDYPKGFGVAVAGPCLFRC